jgi:RNA polymerase sigma factor (TIGR02999 family)
MSPPGECDVTGLLQAWRHGDQGALEDLAPLLERELHGIAKRYMAAQPPGQTLQTTALVNEAYIRLIDGKRANFQDRSHFLAVCSQIMRHILVDYERARRAGKRGGGAEISPLKESCAVSPEPDADIIAIDGALDALSRVYPRKARVVELRFFGGLSVEETAAVLEVSQDTVMRDWSLARAWLARKLGQGKAHGRGAGAKS